MQKNLDGATTSHTDDLKTILAEEVKSIVIENINEAHHAEIAATNYTQLSRGYFLMDDYNAALESHKKAIKMKERHVGDSDNKVSYLLMKRLVLLQMNRNIEAGEACHSALDSIPWFQRFFLYFHLFAKR